MEKNETAEMMLGVASSGVAREDFIEKVTFQQRPEGGKKEAGQVSGRGE